MSYEKHLLLSYFAQLLVAESCSCNLLINYKTVPKKEFFLKDVIVPLHTCALVCDTFSHQRYESWFI